MRSIFALGLMTLALNIPAYGQQKHQDANKPAPTLASRTVVTLPPLVFAEPDALNRRTVSSGIAVQVPDFLWMATTAKPDDTFVLPALTPLMATKKPNLKGVSSGFVVKVPDFLPTETHEWDQRP